MILRAVDYKATSYGTSIWCVTNIIAKLVPFKQTGFFAPQSYSAVNPGIGSRYTVLPNFVIPDNVIVTNIAYSKDAGR